MRTQPKYRRGTPEHREHCRTIGKLGLAAAIANNPTHQARAQAAHSSENLRTWARQGYEEAIRRHPHLAATLQEKSREWRLEHPSRPEALVYRIAQGLGFTHLERELRPFPDHFMTVDLGSSCTHEAIFIDGEIHFLPFAKPEEQAERRARALALLESAGYRVLILEPEDLTEATIRTKLQAFITVPSEDEDYIPF